MRSIPFACRLLIATIACLPFLATSSCGQSPEAEAPDLRSLDDLAEFFNDARFDRFPVDFEATLTYLKVDHRGLFVQAQKEAIFVSLLGVEDETRTQLSIGKRVRVVGTLISSKGHIVASNIEVLGEAKEIDPRTLDLSQLVKGMWWSKLVKVRGELKRVIVDARQMQLVLSSGTNQIVCHVNGNERASELKSLVGGELQVTGVMDWETYDSGAPRTALCQVASADRVVVLSKPTGLQVESRVVHSIGGLESMDEGNLVRVWGTVSFIHGDNQFLLEDRTGALPICYAGREQFTIGDELVVDGNLVHSKFGNQLDLRNVKRKSVGQPIPPILNTTARQIIADTTHNRRVLLYGSIRSIQSSGDSRQLVLSSSGFDFRAEFQADDTEFESLRLERGQRLGCRGLVLQAPNTEDVWFTIQVESTDALWSNQEAVQFDRKTVAFWLIGVAVAAIIGSLWMYTLRLQVKRKTKHLAGLAAQLAASYQATKEGVLVLDGRDRVAHLNTQFNVITGLQLKPNECVERLPELLDARFAANEPNDFWSRLAGEILAPVETEVMCSETGKNVVAYIAAISDEKSNDIGKLITLRDISIQKELEDHLVQSQKMEAVGSLAGGIAHDFNNLLLVMGCNLRDAITMIRGSHPTAVERLEDTYLAVERATQLVKNLLGFSRRSDLDLRRASINDVVDRLKNLIVPTFRSTIKIETRLDPEISACMIDETQIEQVLMNVCLNARDSFQGSAGAISISTATSGTDGKHVRVSVTDNGVGMSQESVKRIFEPFYTTKPAGKGTGLGMSMSYGIIKQHGGWISCESAVDVGTTIHIYLPSTCERVGRSEPKAVVPIKNDGPKALGRVLVVDDESAVRRATALMTRRIGCDVVEASCGLEALGLIDENEFDLVLLDYNMPGKSGRDVYLEIQRKRPGLPVVICSGYPHDVRSLSQNHDTYPGFLKKPYRFSDLKEVCESAVANARAT